MGLGGGKKAQKKMGECGVRGGARFPSFQLAQDYTPVCIFLYLPLCVLYASFTYFLHGCIAAYTSWRLFIFRAYS